MVEQLVLGLPVTTSLEAEDFLVSECNSTAARLIHEWPKWPGRACVISGPQGSGKSHLAQVWSAKAGARMVTGADITGNQIDSRHVVVEDVDRGGFDERSFFHLLNMSRETGFYVLLTARTPPGEWSVVLPDLRSRFRSLTVAAIGAPDDGLLRLLLVKHFADRQLAVQPDVVDYLLKRMERSAAAAGEIPALLDKAAMSHQRRITRALARDVLGGQFDAAAADA
ncbi:MAG: DnaA/Hda family protein [Hyphomicrobiales bacterium]|nr:DnaA/Hda family protein [Hyphomicrobiales bacterium]